MKKNRGVKIIHIFTIPFNQITTTIVNFMEMQFYFRNPFNVQNEKVEIQSDVEFEKNIVPLHWCPSAIISTLVHQLS